MVVRGINGIGERREQKTENDSKQAKPNQTKRKRKENW
jgi:hypothetical protein